MIWNPSTYHQFTDPCTKTHKMWNVNGRLYMFCISHFASILWIFLQNTLRNIKHLLYTFRISCKFRFLLMTRKNKPRNPLTFCANADPGAKCKKRKKGRETPKKWLKIPRSILSFFAFCNKCIAHQRSIMKNIVETDETVSIRLWFFTFHDSFLIFHDKGMASFQPSWHFISIFFFCKMGSEIELSPQPLIRSSGLEAMFFLVSASCISRQHCARFLPLVCCLFYVKTVFFDFPQMHYLTWPPFSSNRFNY